MTFFMYVICRTASKHSLFSNTLFEDFNIFFYNWYILRKSSSGDYTTLLIVKNILFKKFSFAWLIFASEKLCEKAYEDISKQTVEGRTLTVDFCGAKAKTRPQKDRSQLPINPLELFVGGLPPSTSKDQMKVIFRQATNISFPKQARNKNKL